MGFYRVAVYYNKTQHTNNTSHKITHHTQTNTAHKTTQTIKDTAHNECNANTITTAINIITTTIK
jgi:hypothetical protein